MAVTLYGVFDIDRIINDLIEIQQSTPVESEREGVPPKVSERGFARKAGIDYTLINRLVKKKQRSIDVADMAKWLEAGGLSMQDYFNRYASAESLTEKNVDSEIVKYVCIAVKKREKREQLRAYLKSLVADELRREKSRQ